MNAHYPERNMPLLSVDMDGIRNGFRDLEYAHLCGNCELAASRAVSDIARLMVQINELYAALGAERLRSANLEAAIRAALGAQADGEADPLAYLRDELPGNAGGDAYGARSLPALEAQSTPRDAQRRGTLSGNGVRAG